MRTARMKSARALGSFNASGPSAFSIASSGSRCRSTGSRAAWSVISQLTMRWRYGQYNRDYRGGVKHAYQPPSGLLRPQVLLYRPSHCPARSAREPAPSAAGKPIRIGSTLPLTGPLASLAVIHKVTAEIYVENLNKRGGLLGRPVEWLLRDDQSKPELTRTIYEQLITADKVDLVQSPYATASILAAMGVAQRYNRCCCTSFGIPARQVRHAVPDGRVAFDPDNVWPNLIFDAAAEAAQAAEDGRGRHQQVSSVHHISVGAREVMKKRGAGSLADRIRVRQPDFGPIASRVDANPDFLWGGTNGIDRC